MHYHAEVWIKDNKNVDEDLKAVLAPFKDDEIGTAGLFWDWYMIGGRYKGSHVPGYDRETDPAHIDVYTKKVMWPTQWRPLDRDVAAVSSLPDKLLAFTLILPDKVLHERTWNGDEYVDTGWDGNVIQVLRDNNITDGYLVTVDYHD